MGNLIDPQATGCCAANLSAQERCCGSDLPVRSDYTVESAKPTAKPVTPTPECRIESAVVRNVLGKDPSFGGMLQDPQQLGHFELELQELSELPRGADGPRPPHRFSTGSVYAGQWRRNQRHGYGRQQWMDGSVFEGQWLESQAEGKGRFKLGGSGGAFVGEWKRSRFHGLGTFYGSGSCYIGTWKDGEKEGFGIERGTDGEAQYGEARYEGGFARGQKHGFGVCTWADGSQYAGDWSANQISGRGAIALVSLVRKGHHLAEQGQRTYSGQWAEAQKHGFGLYRWMDGRSYSGQYMQDQASGFGVFKWTDGRRYEGFWQFGKQHGPGRNIGAGGRTTVRRWQHGAAGERLDTGAETGIQSSEQVEVLPGKYSVTHDGTTLSSGLSLDSQDLQKLPNGTLITVTEVVWLMPEHRVRGRLENPEGWISLMNLSTGHTWASPL